MRVNAGCRNALKAVPMIRLLRPGAGLADITSFLIVCDNEGVSVKQLAYLGGTSTATISRSINYLARSPECASIADHLCLLRLSLHPNDGRRRAVFLTDDGQHLKRDIGALFSSQVTTSGGATP